MKFTGKWMELIKIILMRYLRHRKTNMVGILLYVDVSY